MHNQTIINFIGNWKSCPEQSRRIEIGNSRHRRAGFTLVEVLVATFIFGLLAALVAAFAVYFFQTYSFSFEQNQSVAVAQNGMTTMIREIREARSADNGAYTIVEATDNSFTFYSDVTNDGRSDRVRYFLNGTQLQKGVIEPTEVPVSYPSANEQFRTISDSVDNAGQALFSYYNGDWPGDAVNNPLTLSQRLLNTRFVSVYVRINIQTGNGSQPFELSSGVQIRSLKDNL